MLSVPTQSAAADDIRELRVPAGASAADLLAEARQAGLVRDADDPAVYAEDADEPLGPSDPLSAGDGTARSFYVGPGAPIAVTVSHDGRRVGEDFSPASTVRRVERWAARALDLRTDDPRRLVLRVADTEVKVDEGRHVGALDRNRDRALHFDLVVGRGPEVTVTITVDLVERKIRRGRRTVAEIKRAGEVAQADVLEQLVNGQLVELADDASVDVRGGEEFVSHPRDSASS